MTTVAALEATLLPPKADKAEPVDPSNVDELLQMAPQEGIWTMQRIKTNKI